MVRKFLAIGNARRLALTRAFAAVSVIRMALWLLPFRIVHRTVERFARPVAKMTRAPLPVDLLTWAIPAVSRRVPHASCLTQALAARLLLTREGHEATLRVGVAKELHGPLRAHAWVECNGQTILGDSRVDTFIPFPPLNSRS